MKFVSEASAHPGSTWPSTSQLQQWKKVTKMERAEGEETLASLARTFHLASRRMLQKCQHKEKHKEMKDVASMKGLDLPVCRGIDKIVILKKPEALNRFLPSKCVREWRKGRGRSKSIFQTQVFHCSTKVCHKP